MTKESHPDQDKPPRARAVVLLSGGLDSATTAAIARSEGYLLHALTVDYGQRHRFELDAARRIADALDVVRHVQLRVDLAELGGSALTGDMDVPKQRSQEEMEDGIPITYVPARNTVLLSLGLAYAEVCQSEHLFLGVNAVDYSGYPDCRPEFVRQFEQLANVATRASVEDALHFSVHAPLIDMTKGQIIRRGMELGVDYALTFSCYDPTDKGVACGSCDACLLRQKGFEEAGIQDPIEYAS